MNKANKTILIVAFVVAALGVVYAYNVSSPSTEILESTRNDEYYTVNDEDNLNPEEEVADTTPANPPSAEPKESDDEPLLVQQPDDVVDRQAIARSLTSQSACEAEGGNWKRNMSLEGHYCVLPTTDAGRACTDRSQCESWCQAPKGASSGESVIGTCAAFTSASCSQEVVDGVAEAEACM